MKEIFGGLATTEEILKLSSSETDKGEKATMTRNLNHLVIQFLTTSFENLGRKVPKALAKQCTDGAMLGFTVIESRLTELDKYAREKKGREEN